MCPARSRADAAKARVATPSTILHCDPSLLSAPASSRKIRFDRVGSAPRFVIKVISGVMTAPRSVSRSCAAVTSQAGRVRASEHRRLEKWCVH